MERLATENLFLLEFLVDDIKMDERCDCDTPPGDLCVSFQFLDNEPLEVCEKDFSPARKYGKEDNTKSGKSCLFSLTPEQVQSTCTVFDLVVTVFKKMQPGWLPEKICVGSALISIANLFVELIRSMEMETESQPSAKTLKDCFDLVDSSGSLVGKISLYMRMSCFGKLIVTQFQMNLEDQSVLFKDKGGQSLYRYKKARKDEPIEPQQQQQPQNLPQGFGGPQGNFGPQPNLNCPMTPCFPGGNPAMMSQPMMSPYQEMDMYGFPGGQSSMFPIGQSMIPCNECSAMMEMGPYGNQPPACMTDGSPQMLTPCEECGTLLPPQFKAEVAGSPSAPQDPPGNYQEIGATMGGNALTIRVHKDKNKIQQVDGDSIAASEGSCCCSPTNMGAKKPKKEFQATVTGTQPQNLDFRPGFQQGDPNLPFSFKMSGAGGAPNNNVIINPPVCTKPDGTKFAEISDPNKETFVLRIGKKSEGVQKKANLELELCTPRGPEMKPIPKKETRDCQYDPADCQGDGAKKKGKDKKGKGNKGKKK